MTTRAVSFTHFLLMRVSSVIENITGILSCYRLIGGKLIQQSAPAEQCFFHKGRDQFFWAKRKPYIYKHAKTHQRQ